MSNENFAGKSHSFLQKHRLKRNLGKLALLVRHPLIGRPVEFGMHELVISRGSTGYVALYSFEQEQDVGLILAICHQREAGFWGLDEN